jgi:hypothetical protein
MPLVLLIEDVGSVAAVEQALDRAGGRGVTES